MPSGRKWGRRVIFPAIELQPGTQVAGTLGAGSVLFAGTDGESFSATFGESLRETAQGPELQAPKASNVVDEKAATAQVADAGPATALRSLAKTGSGSDIWETGESLTEQVAGDTSKQGSIASSNGRAKISESVRSDQGEASAASSVTNSRAVKAEGAVGSESGDDVVAKADERAQAAALTAEAAVSVVRSSVIGSAADGGLAGLAKNLTLGPVAEGKTDAEIADLAAQGGRAADAGARGANGITKAVPSAVLDAAEKNGAIQTGREGLERADALVDAIAEASANEATLQEGTGVKAQGATGAGSAKATAGPGDNAVVAGAQAKVAEPRPPVIARSAVARTVNAGARSAGAKSLAAIVQNASLTGKVVSKAGAAVESLNAVAPGGSGAGGPQIFPAASVLAAGFDRQVVVPVQAEVAQATLDEVSQALPSNVVRGTDQTANSTAGSNADRLAISGPDAGTANKASRKTEIQQAATAKAQAKVDGAATAGAGNASTALHGDKVPVATSPVLAGARPLVVPVHGLPHVLPNPVASGTGRNGTQAASAVTARSPGDAGVGSKVPVAAGPKAEAKFAVEGVAGSSTGRPAMDGTRGGDSKQLAQAAPAEQSGPRQGGSAAVNPVASSAQTAASSTGGSVPLVDGAVHASVPAVVNAGGSNTAGGSNAAIGSNTLSAAPTAAHLIAAPGLQGIAAGAGTPAASGAGAVSQALSGGVAGGVGGAGRTEPVTVAEPHRTLLATPTTLEVGVPDGTQGWLRIRAQVGEQGQVNASVAAGSSASQEMLHRELPALNAYLHGEQVAVTATVAERSFASTSVAQPGVADDRATSTNAGLAQGGTAGGGQQGDAGGQGVMQGAPERSDARNSVQSYDGSGGLSDAVLASSTNSGSEGVSGRWLNVRA